MPQSLRIPLCAGAARGMQTAGTDRLAVAFVDAGAPVNGWADALRWANRDRLPFLLIVSDRGANTRSKPSLRASAPLLWPELTKLGRSLHLPHFPVDGEDAVAVYRVVQETSARARSGGGPSVIWAMLSARASANAPTAAQAPAGLHGGARNPFVITNQYECLDILQVALNLYTDSMFLLRSPRPWPPAAVLFALLIAATFTSGKTASAQTPNSVAARNPCAGEQHSFRGRTHPCEQSEHTRTAADAVFCAADHAADETGTQTGTQTQTVPASSSRLHPRLPPQPRPTSSSSPFRYRISRTRPIRRGSAYRLRFPLLPCRALKHMVLCRGKRPAILSGRPTSRSTASSIRWLCGCIRWATSTPRSSP